MALPPDVLSRTAGATEIYLIRHGNALPPPDEIVPGSYDEQHLSPRGRQQAESLVATLALLRPVAIYSSPTWRARETAEPIARTLDMPVTIEPDLREVDLTTVRPIFADDVSAKDRATALSAYLKEIEQKALQIGVWDEIIGPGASSAIRSRIVPCVDKLAARHTGQRIAIFSHAGAINAYLAVVLGLARDFVFPIVNTSISSVAVNDGRYRVLGINSVAHLWSAGLME